jgi:hypothetical protein
LRSSSRSLVRDQVVDGEHGDREVADDGQLRTADSRFGIYSVGRAQDAERAEQNSPERSRI